MKKVLATLLASTMALSTIAGLTACGDRDGNGGSKGKTLTVWAPEASHEVYKQLAEDWAKETEGYSDWTVKFEAHAEGEAETDFGADPASGADVFFFESGQIATMKEKLYLQDLPADITAAIKERDGACANPMIDEETGLAWGFPATNDNGYFMWYDKTFFTNEDDLNSLDKMLELINEYNVGKDEDQKKYLVFPYDNGWYEVSWFFGTGCSMDWVTGTKNYFTDISTTPEGYGAALASVKYCQNAALKTGDDGIITEGFANGTVVAALDGTWISKSLQEKLAENGDDYEEKMGAVKLPKFTTKVNGVEGSYQMGSFTGGKFCGVNRYKNNATTINASISLANYLTGAKGQLARFKETGAVPTNVNVAASDEVKEDMLAKALSDQAAAGGYAQLSQDGLWESMKAFGTACHDGTYGTYDAPTTSGENSLQTALDNLALAMAKGGTLVTTR